MEAQPQHQGKAGGRGGEAAEPLRPEPGLPVGGSHQGGVHVVQGVQDVFRSHTSYPSLRSASPRAFRLRARLLFTLLSLSP